MCVCLLDLFLLTFAIDYNSFPNHNLVNCFCILLAADIISTVEFNYSGDLLATGDKGGRVVIFQREQEVSDSQSTSQMKASLSRVTWKEGEKHGHFSVCDFTYSPSQHTTCAEAVCPG